MGARGGHRNQLAWIPALWALAAAPMQACAPGGEQAAEAAGAGEAQGAAEATGEAAEPAAASRAPAPEARGFSQLVYHPPSGRVVMFGGESTHRTALDDVWTYDIQSNEWSEVQADPHPVDADGRTAAYDAESDRIIVHFTTQLDRSGPNGLRRISETWAYDPASGSWADMRPDPAPFGLMGARMVYDAAADRMILFGGADFTKESWPMFNETWAYDFNSNTWSQRHPQSPPPGRSYFGMVYDAGAGRTLMFGGTMAAEDSASVDEMWAYDYGADRWERVDYTGSAPADHHPAMAYAAGLDRSFYLVGRSLHAFEYGTRSWTELAFDEALGVRYFSAMAYDEAGDRLVVFGGGPRGLRYDDQTWLYDPSSDQWQPGGPPD